MKESFEHDPYRNFDWKEGVPLAEKNKLVEHLNNESFYDTGHNESITDSNKVDSALRNARIKIPDQERNAVLSQLEAHKNQFRDEYEEFIKNDEELSEIEKELANMNLRVEDFNKDIEFTDPVVRDQFEEMAQTYRHLAQRNIEIQDKIKTLINTLN